MNSYLHPGVLNCALSSQILVPIFAMDTVATLKTVGNDDSEWEASRRLW